MAAHSSRTSTHTADIAAEAPGSVFDSIKQGASDLQLSAAEALPATSRFLGRVVYKTSYAVSFGVAFPVMMIVRVMPKENALVHGFVDGALAARDRVHDWSGGLLEDDHHEPEVEAIHASENGTAHRDEADHAAPRRPRAKRTAPRKAAAKSSSRKKS